MNQNDEGIERIPSGNRLLIISWSIVAFFQKSNLNNPPRKVTNTTQVN